VKAETLSLTQLFNKPICFMVPLFQRPYVWTKGDHWIPLWEDIRTTTERLLAERAMAVADAEEPTIAEDRTAPHFLGAVVLEQIPVGAGMIDVRSVIDGQQRLTTLQLFLDAAHDVAKEFDDPSAKFFSKLTQNDPDLVRTTADHYKVWPTNLDQEAFRLTLEQDNDPHPPQADVTHTTIWLAHEYFCDALREWLADDGDAVADQLDALRTTLWRLIKLVVIDLEPNDNAQVIFETLNARGTPLLASDLVKNFLFRQALAQHRDVDALYRTHWAQLDDPWWRELVTQGRLYRPRLDVFFYHWLTLRLAAEFGVHELFPQFKRYSSGLDTERLLADISRHAATYRSFEEMVPGTFEHSFFYRLRAMETTTATPVLLYVLSHDDAAIASEQKRLMMSAIESWLVRRVLCRLTTKNYNQVFMALLVAVSGEPSRVGDITVGFLRSLGGESQVWPTDDQVEEAALDLPMYRIISRGRLRMALEAIEAELRTSFADERTVPTGLSIEHVLPQSWELNWPLAEWVDEAEATVDRDRLKHSLGNLTLVNGKLNTGLSNDPWSKKRVTLQEHTTLFLNKDLVTKYIDAWDESTIRERGRALTQVVCRIWPGPDSVGWPEADAGVQAAEAYMSTGDSGADIGLESGSTVDTSAKQTFSHDRIRETVTTEFLRSNVDAIDAWLTEQGIDVKHKKGSHHSLYVGKHWLGGFYYARRWIRFWLRERTSTDHIYEKISHPESVSLKDVSVNANIYDAADLELFKEGVLARLDVAAT
jgi:hypothetical protein